MTKKTVLERFKEIEELEVADGPEVTVKDILPYFCENVEQALQRLEAIDNANPSEALECLDKVYSRLPQWDLSRNIDQCNIIKQALLKAQEPKQYLKWEDLTFSKEPTYIKATLNNVVVTLECWLEGKKEWCRANFNNAPCNNLVFVHHGYDDDTDTQPILFDALGFIAESDLGNHLVFPTHNGKGSINNEELD